MIAINDERQNDEASWQPNFLAMLPEIKQRLRAEFWQLAPEAREDAIEEAIVHSLLSYCRLHEQGRAEVATPMSLAWYSARQIKRGRPSVGSMNSKEPLSRYAQIGNGIQIEPLGSNWMDAMVEDKKAAVPDQVAAKIDVAAWFATLTERTTEIAKDLAFGFSTSEIAKKHGVTPGRISQLRRTLKESWSAFQGEAVVGMA